MESVEASSPKTTSKHHHRHHSPSLQRYDSVSHLYSALIQSSSRDKEEDGEGVILSDEEVSLLFDKLDADHKGFLSPKQFHKFALDFLHVEGDSKAPGLDGLVKSLFDEVDADGNGEITKKELESFFKMSAGRYQTAPIVNLLDGVPVKVLRAATPFAFESGALTVMYKLARNETAKDYTLHAGTAGLAHTDAGYALIFTGTRVSSSHSPYEVLLLKVHKSVKEKHGTLKFLLDDSHTFKHHLAHYHGHHHAGVTGTAHTKRFVIKLKEGEDSKAIAADANAILNGKYDAWQAPTNWWEAQRIKTTDERLTELTNALAQLAEDHAELRKEVAQLRKLVPGTTGKS